MLFYNRKRHVILFSHLRGDFKRMQKYFMPNEFVFLELFLIYYKFVEDEVIINYGFFSINKIIY